MIEIWKLECVTPTCPDRGSYITRAASEAVRGVYLCEGCGRAMVRIEARPDEAPSPTIDVAGREAAEKLCQNLLAQFSPRDAQLFAAYVLARVTSMANQSLGDGIHAVGRVWTQLALDLFPTESTACSCGLPCTAQTASDGRLTVVHHGAACAAFKTRFAESAKSAARDHLGWTNEQPTPTTPPDDGSARFRLLELT